MGREQKAGMGTTYRKCLKKVIMQYTGWMGWILQLNVSLKHCLDPFAKAIETLK